MSRRPSRLRAALSVLALAGALGVSAQGTFTVRGRVKVERGSDDGCKVVVYRDGEKQRVLTQDLNRISLDLDIGHTYLLSFEKEGFVTKKLSFDTHAPAEAAANGFTPFDFVVALFKQYDGINTVVFNQPVGMIRYDATLDDFDYDTDYTKSIQSALAAAQEEVARKQEEEKAREEAAAKEKADQDKAKAKADAEAQKQAAELARQQAKQKQEQEAAARKAEQERLAAEARKPKEKPAPPPPAPPPAPVAKVEKPARPRPEPRPVRNALSAKPLEGDDTRRAGAPHVAGEPSRMRPAKANQVAEARPKFEASPTAPVARHEELIVEPNQVVTVIKLDNGTFTNEYRKVVRKYSGTFYFKDGQSCTRLVYESEALAEAGR